MKTILFVVLLLTSSSALAQIKQNEISGIVTDGELPLFKVSVVIKNSEVGVTTNENGKYSIRASPGDVLVFSYIGKQSVSIIVEDVTERLNIEMQTDVEELDEVVVTKKKNSFSQKDLAIAYDLDSTIVNTSLGYLNPDTAFFEFYTLAGDDFKGSSDVLEALRRKLHGIRIETRLNELVGYEKVVLLTSGASAKAIFEVDGVLMKYTPVGIKMEDVIRVGIMYGRQAEQHFGKIAVGGVVFINTKKGIHGAREGNTKLPYDRAKLRNNIYKDNAIAEASIQTSLPGYLIELQQTTNFSDAKISFNKNKEIYKSNPNFFIDAYNYFMKQTYHDFAYEISVEQMAKISENAVWLKAWAYHFDMHGQSSLSENLYEKIYRLRPTHVQSYLDLANAYRFNKELKKAASIYARYNYLIDEGMLQEDSTEISLFMRREAENILINGKDSLKLKNEFTKSLPNPGDTRLVFEWNDNEAEFDLQFVNPQKHYHTWSHTREANLNRIKDEKIKGYACKEFFIDDSLLGRWQVNINYKGNKKMGPTYLKVIIYSNYGSPAQSREVKVFRLGLRNVNRELFSLYNSNNLTAN